MRATAKAIRKVAAMPPQKAPRNGQLKTSARPTRDMETRNSAGKATK